MSGYSRLGGARDLHGFTNHGSGHQRYRQAERVRQFLQHGLLEIRRDGGIDDAHLVTGLQQRCRNGRMPNGAVASRLENAGKKKTTLGSMSATLRLVRRTLFRQLF